MIAPVWQINAIDNTESSVILLIPVIVSVLKAKLVLCKTKRFFFVKEEENVVLKNKNN